MSRFLSPDFKDVSPYIPGEQPTDRSYIKLNANENPFTPSPEAIKNITAGLCLNLNRYSDSSAVCATEAVAKMCGTDADNIMLTNGSDEALFFSFICYGRGGAVFPDITYGFYSNIAALLNISYEQKPLDARFCINPADYRNCGKMVVIANPNAQTGIALDIDGTEDIIKNNPENIVLVDQAYADFSDFDAIPLTDRYENLLVVGTFSKSRSLAGARIGYAVGNSSLIDDLKAVKYAFNPYNVNAISQKFAEIAAADGKYLSENVRKDIALREQLPKDLLELGFEVLPSSANFVAARSKDIGGEELYLQLKQRGILVRHFPEERIKDFVRITIGTEPDNTALISAIGNIIGVNR